MIIENGYIKFKKVVDGGIDYTTGHMADSVIELSEAIPCQYRTNKLNYQGINDGNKFTIASYTILIEEMEITDETFVQLYVSDELLGEFPISKIIHLDRIGLIQILV